MKKKVLLIAALFTAGLSFAQDGLTSKKGVPILPEAGDYAIGFDAGNLLNYGGNLLNGASGNSLNNLNLMRTNTIYGKYFIDANKAYRGMVRLGLNTATNRSFETDFSPENIDMTNGGFVDPNATVEDEFKTSNTAITLGGGIEMRQGKGRLQGVYGPMALLSFSSSSTENSYGNNIEDLANNDPNFAGSRTTETKSGSTISFAVGGFAGVEYFFAPKISLGAEIMWTIAFSSTGDGESTTETPLFEDTANPTTATGGETTTVETAGGSSFGFDTRPNGVISLNFHF